MIIRDSNCTEEVIYAPQRRDKSRDKIDVDNLDPWIARVAMRQRGRIW